MIIANNNENWLLKLAQVQTWIYIWMRIPQFIMKSVWYVICRPIVGTVKYGAGFGRKIARGVVIEIQVKIILGKWHQIYDQECVAEKQKLFVTVYFWSSVDSSDCWWNMDGIFAVDDCYPTDIRAFVRQDILYQYLEVERDLFRYFNHIIW